MLRKLLTDEQEIDQSHLVANIYQSLKQIQQKLQEEIEAKQKTIEDSWDELRKLRGTLSQKDECIEKLENKIAEAQRNMDGNRQLINKLLNDLERAQQDIEWYKRTYESRSLLGYIKQYLKGNS